MEGLPVRSGALVVWHGLFGDAELDTIARHGDSLTLEKGRTVRQRPGLWGHPPHADRLGRAQSRNEMFYRRMEEAVLALNASYFRFDLWGVTNFQYALYGGPEGGHFDWHKDYGRDPTDPSRDPRKLTLSLQLSNPSDYEGCELQVRAGNQIDVAPKLRGTLVAFPANVLHQVTPIRSGIRKALVLWAVGPEFR